MNQVRAIAKMNEDELAHGLAGTSGSWHAQYRGQRQCASPCACQCHVGFAPPLCANTTCPANCHAAEGHGECDKGRCRCAAGWRGSDCAVAVCPLGPVATCHATLSRGEWVMVLRVCDALNACRYKVGQRAP